MSATAMVASVCVKGGLFYKIDLLLVLDTV